MLLNLSNHPSSNWPANQIDAAVTLFQEITDMPFPQISPEMTSPDLDLLVSEYEAKVIKTNLTAIHIMGELTFTIRLVNRLKAIGYRCIASTTERIVSEDGNGNKTSAFKFVQFRDY